MGIYFEHKLVKPDPKGTELEKLYYEGQQEVLNLFKENDGFIVLKRDVKKVWNMSRTNYKPVVPYALPVEANVYLPSMGSVNVRYADKAPIRSDKGYDYVGNRILIEERLFLSQEKHIDLAWFLIKVVGFVMVKNNKGEVVLEARNKLMEIDNPMIEVQEEASKIRLLSKLDNMIYFDDSPIYNMEAAQYLIDYFGLNIQPTHIDKMMLELRNAVLSADHNKNPNLNVEKFIAVAKTLGKKEYPEAWDGVIPEQGFNELQLNSFKQSALNDVSKALGTPYPPKCKKKDQIRLILEYKVVPQE